MSIRSSRVRSVQSRATNRSFVPSFLRSFARSLVRASPFLPPSRPPRRRVAHSRRSSIRSPTRAAHHNSIHPTRRARRVTVRPYRPHIVFAPTSLRRISGRGRYKYIRDTTRRRVPFPGHSCPSKRPVVTHKRISSVWRSTDGRCDFFFACKTKRTDVFEKSCVHSVGRSVGRSRRECASGVRDGSSRSVDVRRARVGWTSGRIESSRFCDLI